MRLLLSAMLALSMVGCVTDEPSSSADVSELSSNTDTDGSSPGTATGAADGVEVPGGVTIATTFSFMNTCIGNSLTFTATGVVVRAHANSCRRNDHSSTGPVSWVGNGCSSDIANCNGRLVCGGC